MGGSRGGLTTKIHALVDANGLPIALKLSEGQAHDGHSAADMLSGIGAGQILLADRAYDSDALRKAVAERKAWANIKPMPRRVNVPAFSPFLYRYRFTSTRGTVRYRFRARVPREAGFPFSTGVSRFVYVRVRGL